MPHGCIGYFWRGVALDKCIPAHLFSTISLMALAGRWITSPAAILFTTVSSSLRMTPGSAMARPPLTAGNTKKQMFSLPPPKYVRALSLLFACDQAWRTQSPERGTEEPLLCSHLQQELQEVEAVGHLQACKQRSGAPRCLSPGLSHSFHMQRAIANDLLLVAVPSRLQHTHKICTAPTWNYNSPKLGWFLSAEVCVCDDGGGAHFDHLSTVRILDTVTEKPLCICIPPLLFLLQAIVR